MKFKEHLIILVFLAFICIGASAQERLIEKGNEKFESFSFTPAIDIYKKVIDKGYISADLLRKLGNSYYYNSDYKEAGQTFQKLVDEFPEELTPEDYFKYAQTLKSLGSYKASDAVMNKFIEITERDKRASAFNLDRDYMKEIIDNSGRYTIGPFEYNSPFNDFAPSFYKNGLIFSSDRDTGNFARYRHTWNSRDFLDLYQVHADTIKGKEVLKLNENINTRLHESTSVITKDGKVMYFTRNNSIDGSSKNSSKKIIRLKIYRAYLLQDGTWGSVEELPFNSNQYSIANPALSPDEKTLYFASDMPGTFGESDIFKVSINKDRTFSNPENLGSNINTEARETFPFVTDDEILYFSSDGHPGLGGLDVFATKIKRNDYSGKVLNLGKPINSLNDDFTFVYKNTLKTGYFASNREGGMGGDDIYSFVELKPLVFECIQNVTGTVRDKISNAVLVGATIKVINENNEDIASTITDSKGNYSLVLDCNRGNFVRALMDGYIPFEEYVGVSDGKPKIIDFYLDRDQISAGFGDDLAKLLQLSTIYFDFNKFNINNDSELEIEKVIAAMEKFPSLKLKVNAHTDSRGPAAYNLWLSQKRAEATVNYMIKRGISKDRLSSEGFGESKILNECIDGVGCSAKKHDINRRSEFIILE